MSHKSKYCPYSQARAQALDLGVSSRSEYIKWHRDNNIKYLPRFPERVYKEWVSWNEYLGTQNVFKGNITTVLRPFWEAVKWAQEFAGLHKLNTVTEWMQWCAEHKDELPPDIPHRPDQHYDEWKQVGWPGWLGTDIRGKLKAAKADTGLFCLASHHSLKMPGNVYALIYVEQGLAELKQRFTDEPDLRLVRVWHMPRDSREEVLTLVKSHGVDRDDGSGYFIPVVANLIFELDNILRVYRS